MPQVIERPAPHPDNMLKHSEWTDHWWDQNGDKLAARVMERDLAEFALEGMNDLVHTIAEMVAEGQSNANIGQAVREKAEEWLAMHVDRLVNFKQ